MFYKEYHTARRGCKNEYIGLEVAFPLIEKTFFDFRKSVRQADGI